MKRILLVILLSLSFLGSAEAATTARQVDFLLAGYRHPTTDEVLSGGKVKTFLTGTSTLSSCWTDRAKGGTATNPVVLDSSGKAELYCDNIYKFEIYDSNDILLETISGIAYSDDVLGDVTGDINATDGTKVLDSGTDGTDASFVGDIQADDGTEVLENGTDGTDSVYTGAHIGQVQADDTTLVLDPGADGSAVILNATGISGTAIKDEDDLSSDSATHLATQQSIKAYVDTRVIVQVTTVTDGAAASGTTAMPIDNTIPQITEGDQYLTASITPTVAGNTIEVEVTGYFQGLAVGMALFNTDAHATNALSAGHGYSGNAAELQPITLRYEALASALNGTTATTFTVRAGIAAGATTYFNRTAATTPFFGGVMASSIVIYELNSTNVT